MWVVSFITILIVHWIADFVLQTHWQATNKSSDNDTLTAHIAVYSACWILPIMFLFDIYKYNHFGAFNAMVLFVVPTAILHWVQDYYTSRWTKKLREKGDFHNFFVVIGLDQVLHYFQLFGLYYWLMT